MGRSRGGGHGPPKRLQKLENWSGTEPTSLRSKLQLGGEANSVARCTPSTIVGEPGYMLTRWLPRPDAPPQAATTVAYDDMSFESSISCYPRLSQHTTNNSTTPEHCWSQYSDRVAPPFPFHLSPVQSRDSSSSSGAISGRRTGRSANYQNRDTMHWEEGALKVPPLTKFLFFVVSNFWLFSGTDSFKKNTYPLNRKLAKNKKLASNIWWVKGRWSWKFIALPEVLAGRFFIFRPIAVS